MTRHAIVMAAAIAALALGGCGGGSDDNGSGSDSAQAPATASDGQSSNGTGTQSDGSDGAGNSGSAEGGSAGTQQGGGSAGNGGSGGRKRSGGSGEIPPLDLDDKAPAPKVGGKTQGKKPDVSGPPKTAVDFTGIARQVFETSRYFCRREGVDGMRKEYDISSDDPKDIAQEAAKRNYPRGFPDAVYFGCLEGLQG